MSEATQAGERLRRHRAEWSEEYRDTQQGSDEATLAAEYLRLTDPTPITREWMHSIGFADRENQLGPRYDPACRIKTSNGPLVLWNFNGEYWLMEEMDRFPIRTRGQLRCLLMGLGITPPSTE